MVLKSEVGNSKEWGVLYIKREISTRCFVCGVRGLIFNLAKQPTLPNVSFKLEQARLNSYSLGRVIPPAGFRSSIASFQ